MNLSCADGAMISAPRVVRLECSKCGLVEVTAYPKNDLEVDKMMLEHAVARHGGSWRAAQLRGRQ